MRVVCLLQAVLEDFVEKELGGRVLTCMTGSAPTAPEVIDFLRDTLVAPILEGYGSTEAGTLPKAVGSFLVGYSWRALSKNHRLLQLMNLVAFLRHACTVQGRLEPRHRP